MKPIRLFRHALGVGSLFVPYVAIAISSIEVKSISTISKKNQKSPTFPYVSKPRIQETRGVGGVVSEIKIINKGPIPSYYIYPSQQEQDSVVNNRPDMDISTPNWQIKW